MSNNDNKQPRDRISDYLRLANRGIIFDELSKDYLAKAGVLDLLEDVPVPILVDDEGMSTLTIALGMARIVGGDNNFKYASQYIGYIKRCLGDVALRVLLSEGAKAGTGGDYEVACMYFRTALILDPHSVDALYLYGRALKDAYEIEEHDEDYVGNFKAESLQVFEILTVMHPDFAMGFYFLGYGYLNLGLYTKAKLTWDEFMKLMEGQETDGDNLELVKEIAERLRALEAPMIVEQACNLILAGDYVSGKTMLKQNKERFEQWWPLWYYLGVADSSLGNVEAAISDYKKALQYSPSNIDVMKELCNIYEAIGDKENLDKYTKKIQIVHNNMEEELAGEDVAE